MQGGEWVSGGRVGGGVSEWMREPIHWCHTYVGARGATAAATGWSVLSTWTFVSDSVISTWTFVSDSALSSRSFFAWKGTYFTSVLELRALLYHAVSWIVLVVIRFFGSLANSLCINDFTSGENLSTFIINNNNRNSTKSFCNIFSRLLAVYIRRAHTYISQTTKGT